MFKAKTHKSIAMDKLMRLAGDIDEIATDGAVSAEAMDGLSADLGVARKTLYAGLSMSGHALSLEHKVQFVVCTGGCQEYGALDCLGELLSIAEQRSEDGEASFDVVPRSCLNRCQSAPVIEVRSPEGQGVLAQATPELVADAVKQIFS